MNAKKVFLSTIILATFSLNTQSFSMANYMKIGKRALGLATILYGGKKVYDKSKSIVSFCKTPGAVEKEYGSVRWNRSNYYELVLRENPKSELEYHFFRPISFVRELKKLCVAKFMIGLSKKLKSKNIDKEALEKAWEKEREEIMDVITKMGA